MYRSKFQSYKIEVTRLDDGSYDVVADVQVGRKKELSDEWEVKNQVFHSTNENSEVAILDVLLTTNQFLQNEEYTLFDDEKGLLN